MCSNCRFFFPTFENDRLLCCLEDAAEGRSADARAVDAECIEDVTDAVVIPEDLNLEDVFQRKDAVLAELRR